MSKLKLGHQMKVKVHKYFDDTFPNLCVVLHEVMSAKEVGSLDDSNEGVRFVFNL